MLDLGTILFNTAADLKGLRRDLDAAKKMVDNSGVTFKVQVPELETLTPKVDHKNLTELNKHLAAKQKHAKEVQGYFDANPLWVKTDVNELNRLSSNFHQRVIEHEKVQTYFDRHPLKIKLDTKGFHDAKSVVDTLASTDREKVIRLQRDPSDRKSLERSMEKFAKDIGKEFRAGQKQGGVIGGILQSALHTATLPLRALTSAAGGLLHNLSYGASVGLMNDFGKGMAKAFETRTGRSMSEMGAGFESRAVGTGHRAVQRTAEAFKFDGGVSGVGRELNETSRFLENTVVDLVGNVADAIVDILTGKFSEIPNRLGQAGLNVAGAGLRIGTTPLRIRNNVYAQQASELAKNLADLITVEENETLKNADTIYLVRGGFGGQTGGYQSTMETMAYLSGIAEPNTYIEGLNNPRLNNFESGTKDHVVGVLKQILDFMGTEFSEEFEFFAGQFSRLFESAVIDGMDHDAVLAAARAEALRRKYPDKKIVHIGGSGGGFNALTATDLSNRMGTRNVQGVGLMTPVTGTAIPTPENFTAVTGSEDYIHQFFFDVMKTQEGVGLKINNDDGKNIKGLFRPPSQMQNIQGANQGHTYATVFNSPGMMAEIYKAMGSDPRVVNKASMSLFLLMKKASDDRNIQGAIQDSFGLDAISDIFVDFNNPRLALQAFQGLSRYMEGSITKEENPKFASSYKLLQKVLPGYDSTFTESLQKEIEILKTIDTEFTDFYISNGIIKPIESLKKAVQLFPDLEPLVNQWENISARIDGLINQGQSIEQIRQDKDIMALPYAEDVLKMREYQQSGQIERDRKVFDFTQEIRHTAPGIVRTLQTALGLEAPELDLSLISNELSKKDAEYGHGLKSWTFDDLGGFSYWLGGEFSQEARNVDPEKTEAILTFVNEANNALNALNEARASDNLDELQRQEATILELLKKASTVFDNLADYNPSEYYYAPQFNQEPAIDRLRDRPDLLPEFMAQMEKRPKENKLDPLKTRYIEKEDGTVEFYADNTITQPGTIPFTVFAEKPGKPPEPSQASDMVIDVNQEQIGARVELDDIIVVLNEMQDSLNAIRDSLGNLNNLDIENQSINLEPGNYETVSIDIGEPDLPNAPAGATESGFNPIVEDPWSDVTDLMAGTGDVISQAAETIKDTGEKVTQVLGDLGKGVIGGIGQTASEQRDQRLVDAGYDPGQMSTAEKTQALAKIDTGDLTAKVTEGVKAGSKVAQEAGRGTAAILGGISQAVNSKVVDQQNQRLSQLGLTPDQIKELNPQQRLKLLSQADTRAVLDVGGQVVNRLGAFISDQATHLIDAATSNVPALPQADYFDVEFSVVIDELAQLKEGIATGAIAATADVKALMEALSLQELSALPGSAGTAALPGRDVRLLPPANIDQERLKQIDQDFPTTKKRGGLFGLGNIRLPQKEDVPEGQQRDLRREIREIIATINDLSKKLRGSGGTVETINQLSAALNTRDFSSINVGKSFQAINQMETALNAVITQIEGYLSEIATAPSKPTAQLQDAFRRLSVLKQIRGQGYGVLQRTMQEFGTFVDQLDNDQLESVRGSTEFGAVKNIVQGGVQPLALPPSDNAIDVEFETLDSMEGQIESLIQLTHEATAELERLAQIDFTQSQSEQLRNDINEATENLINQRKLFIEQATKSIGKIRADSGINSDTISNLQIALLTIEKISETLQRQRNLEPRFDAMAQQGNLTQISGSIEQLRGQQGALGMLRKKAIEAIKQLLPALTQVASASAGVAGRDMAIVFLSAFDGTLRRLSNEPAKAVKQLRLFWAREYSDFANQPDLMLPPMEDVGQIVNDVQPIIEAEVTIDTDVIEAEIKEIQAEITPQINTDLLKEQLEIVVAGITEQNQEINDLIQEIIRDLIPDRNAANTIIEQRGKGFSTRLESRFRNLQELSPDQIERLHKLLKTFERISRIQQDAQGLTRLGESHSFEGGQSLVDNTRLGKIALGESQRRSQELIAALAPAIAATANDVNAAGQSVAQGFIKGFEAASETHLRDMQGHFSNLVQGIRTILGIASPSKVFEWIGRMSGEGYVQGLIKAIKSGKPLAHFEMFALVDAVRETGGGIYNSDTHRQIFDYAKTRPSEVQQIDSTLNEYVTQFIQGLRQEMSLEKMRMAGKIAALKMHQAAIEAQKKVNAPGQPVVLPGIDEIHENTISKGMVSAVAKQYPKVGLSFLRTMDWTTFFEAQGFANIIDTTHDFEDHGLAEYLGFPQLKPAYDRDTQTGARLKTDIDPRVTEYNNAVEEAVGIISTDTLDTYKMFREDEVIGFTNLKLRKLDQDIGQLEPGFSGGTQYLDNLIQNYDLIKEVIAFIRQWKKQAQLNDFFTGSGFDTGWQKKPIDRNTDDFDSFDLGGHFNDDFVAGFHQFLSPVEISDIIVGLDTTNFAQLGGEQAQVYSQAWRKALQISSPSKVFIQIGRDSGKGLIQGINQEIGKGVDTGSLINQVEGEITSDELSLDDLPESLDEIIDVLDNYLVGVIEAAKRDIEGRSPTNLSIDTSQAEQTATNAAESLNNDFVNAAEQIQTTINQETQQATSQAINQISDVIDVDAIEIPDAGGGGSQPPIQPPKTGGGEPEPDEPDNDKKEEAAKATEKMAEAYEDATKQAGKFNKEIKNQNGFLDGISQSFSDVANKVSQFYGGLEKRFPILRNIKEALGSIARIALTAFGAYSFGDMIMNAGRFAINASVQYEMIEAALKATSRSDAEGIATFDRTVDLARKYGQDVKVLLQQRTAFNAAAMDTPLEGLYTDRLMESISQASMVRELTPDQTSRALVAVEQMLSKGVVSAEELRQQLGDALPGAFQIAARSMGMTTAELSRLVATGGLLSEDFLPRFAEQLSAETQSGVAGATGTAIAQINLFNTELQMTAKRIGDQLDPLRSFVTSIGIFVVRMFGANDILGKFAFILAMLPAHIFLNMNLKIKWMSVIAGLGKSIWALRGHIATLVKQMILATVALEVWGKAIEVINSDGSRGLNDFVRLQSIELERLRKNLGLTSTEIKDTLTWWQQLQVITTGKNQFQPQTRRDLVGQNWLDQSIGFMNENPLGQGLSAVGVLPTIAKTVNLFKGEGFRLTTFSEKMYNDYLAGMSRFRDYLGEFDKNLKEIEERVPQVIALDQQMEALAAELKYVAPDDREGRRRIQEQQRQLLIERNNALQPVAQYQAQLQAVIDTIKRQLTELNDMPLEHQLLPETKLIREELEDLLAKYESVQDNLQSIIRQNLDAISLMRFNMRFLIEDMQGAIRQIDRHYQGVNRAITLKQAEGTLGRPFAAVYSAEARVSQSDKRLEQLDNTLNQLRSDLQDPEVGRILGAMQVTDIDNMSDEQLQRLRGEFQGVQNQSVLDMVEEYRNLIDRFEQDLSAAAEAKLALTDAQIQLQRTLEDFDLAQRDFQRQLRDYRLNLRDNLYQIDDYFFQLADLTRSIVRSYEQAIIDARRSAEDAINEVRKMSVDLQSRGVASQVRSAIVTARGGIIRNAVDSILGWVDLVFQQTTGIIDSDIKRTNIIRQMQDISRQREDFDWQMRSQERQLQLMPRQLERLHNSIDDAKVSIDRARLALERQRQDIFGRDGNANTQTRPSAIGVQQQPEGVTRLLQEAEQRRLNAQAQAQAQAQPRQITPTPVRPQSSVIVPSHELNRVMTRMPLPGWVQPLLKKAWQFIPENSREFINNELRNIMGTEGADAIRRTNEFLDRLPMLLPNWMRNFIPQRRSEVEQSEAIAQVDLGDEALKSRYGHNLMAGMTSDMPVQISRAERPNPGRLRSLDQIGQALTKQRPDAFDPNTPEGRARLAIAYGIAGTEVTGQLTGGMSIGQIFGYMGGSGNAMRGPFQFNTRYHADRASTMQGQIDYIADILTGKTRTPDSKQQADFGKLLLQAQQRGEVQTGTQLRQWLDRALGYGGGGRNWQALTDGWGRTGGLENQLINYLKSPVREIPREIAREVPREVPRETRQIEIIPQEVQVTDPGLMSIAGNVIIQADHVQTPIDPLLHENKDSFTPPGGRLYRTDEPQPAIRQIDLQQMGDGIPIYVPPPSAVQQLPTPESINFNSIPTNDADLESLVNERIRFAQERSPQIIEQTMGIVGGLRGDLSSVYEQQDQALQQQLQMVETERLINELSAFTEQYLRYLSTINEMENNIIQLGQQRNTLADEISNMRLQAAGVSDPVSGAIQAGQSQRQNIERINQEIRTFEGDYQNYLASIEKLRLKLKLTLDPTQAQQLSEQINLFEQLGGAIKQTLDTYQSAVSQFTTADQLQIDQSRNAFQGRIFEAQSNLLQYQGAPWALAGQQQALAVENEMRRFQEELSRVDEIARRTGLSVEEVRANIVKLNQVNLEAIDQQFQDLGETVIMQASGPFKTFFGELIKGKMTVEEAFTSLIDSLLDMFTNLFLDWAFGQIMGMFMGGGGSSVAGLGGGGLFGGGGIGGLFGGLFGFAEGGEVPHGDRQIPPPNEILQALRKEGHNAILATLTPGEQVLPVYNGEAQAYRTLYPNGIVEAYRKQKQQAMIPQYNRGGMVGTFSDNQPVQNLGGGGAAITIPITINAESTADKDRYDEFAKQLKPDVERLVDSRISEAQRPGGVLYTRRQ